MINASTNKLFALAAVAVLAAACTSGGGATTAPSAAAPSESAAASAATGSAAPSTAGKQYTIGYSNAFGIGNGFREEQLCTAKAQALTSGQVSSGTWTNEKEETYPQLQQIRDLIAKKPDAIVFNPNGPDVLNPALQEANTAGIKTIALDAYVTDPNTLNISNDQVAYGYVGASWLFKQLNGKGNVYYMRGLAGHPADNDRHQGVLKALAENPGIKLLPNNDGVATGWDPDTGTKLITDLINSGGYDNVQGIWTSGIDQQIVSAIKGAGKAFVPIVGADLKGFVEMLLNKDGNYEGLKGLAVYNPAAIGGAGVKLALQALNGETIASTDKTVKDSTGKDVQIKAIFLPTPEAYDNTTAEGKAKLAEIDVDGLNNLWPVSWYIKDWTDYTIDQMLACKGPGE
ncbi:MAG TPA: substrate-binding domain-containing protein [Candidatus Limnocylindrales bacterium]|jgi:ribose transport system substrate-binding protein|nr:substrate-binding domain-containing protein [Candidatus Limnocylindrales bacterium]